MHHNRPNAIFYSLSYMACRIPCASPTTSPTMNPSAPESLSSVILTPQQCISCNKVQVNHLPSPLSHTLQCILLISKMALTQVWCSQSYFSRTSILNSSRFTCRAIERGKCRRQQTEWIYAAAESSTPADLWSLLWASQQLLEWK